MLVRHRLLVLLASATLLPALVPVEAVAQARNTEAASRTMAAEPTRRPVTFVPRLTATNGSLVLPLSSEGDLTTRAAALSMTEREALGRAMTAAQFEYENGQTLSLRGIGAWDRILVLGLGQEVDLRTLQSAGAAAGRALLSEPGAVSVLTDGLSAELASELATGMGIGEYRSDLYRTTGRQTEALAATTVISGAADAAQGLYQTRGTALIDSLAWTRDMSNEPANVVYPESFVERTQAAFAGLRGVDIQVLDVAAMERLGMGALLGVGQGSARPPRLMAVSYRGQGAPEGGPIVLVGKGITFDTGGLSLKPGAGMGNMKMDMSGAASVTGAVLALARSGAPVNVVAVSALAENMPGGRALRPADVITAMNGKTIEIISTDAEGRLVLSDALAWSEATLDPAVIVDVATLTGAVGGALGDDYAGLFTRHDALASQLDAAGRVVGERMWRLPLHPTYAADTASTIADIKNTGDGGAGAGTGAYFIGEFVSRDLPWAHLDIANMAWSGAGDTKPAGSAAFGVRLLERFVRDWQPVAHGPENGGS